MDFSLLKDLCSVHAPSGDEAGMTDFLMDYISKHGVNWKVKPTVHHDGNFQESIVLVFGKPRTAVFAHIDNIGFTIGYENALIKIGGPICKSGLKLSGNDRKTVYTTKVSKNGTIHLSGKTKLTRGTTLSYHPIFEETAETVQCCYMDNRLGVWVALKLAETLEDGAIVFSTREEHGGGNTSWIGKFLFESYSITQALICDITWATKGVQQTKGVAISMRDSSIPRRKYLNKIIQLATESGIAFQLEVESAGGSDGSELQRSGFPWQWCFIGAAEENVHSPFEKVYKSDISSMLALYQYLLKRL